MVWNDSRKTPEAWKQTQNYVIDFVNLFISLLLYGKYTKGLQATGACNPIKSI